ncbi:hypothetical protein ACFT5B_06865 [Luteimicrobium sp. NPDC057192]|uniref:hypothetical protein n=1 Tax=Luteimicrobium sp. NPDC057192 TaxID=3346042 RepID=UPI003625EEDD
MTTITTAAELDALPVGSVVLDRNGVAWQDNGRAWASVLHPTTDWLLAYLPATLLTPDEPVATRECPTCHGDGATYEQVRVGRAATPFACSTCGGDGEVATTGCRHEKCADLAVDKFSPCKVATTVDREAANNEAHRRFPEGTVTDALERARFMSGAEWVLALLPATVKPDREALARIIWERRGGWRASWDDPTLFTEEVKETWREEADAILAAWEGKSEAEVREEVAREIESSVENVDPRSSQSMDMLRAARIAREGGRIDG